MPVSFATLGQTSPAEGSTANEEATGSSLIGVIRGPPGPSPSKGPLLICRPQDLWGAALALSFHTGKGWRKASSANV